MKKMKLNLEKCKGCFLCVSVCPTKAITPSGELAESGYEVIKVDESKCIQCGSCYRICPDCVLEILDKV